MQRDQWIDQWIDQWMDRNHNNIDVYLYQMDLNGFKWIGLWWISVAETYA
jgi:hypothetical protein